MTIDTMTDRPMTEYEGALFDALIVLTRAIAKGETTREGLAAKFREGAAMEAELNRKNGAATLEILARIAEADRFYSVQPVRAPFEVIDGGKSD